ncbi:PIGR protein, partial [Rhinopomastus cyanomelas]|nr:PIGR protein [Rhinopomastus cyanomelas]
PVSSTLYGARLLRGEIGGSVAHQCFYSPTSANRHDRKYWCRVARGRGCPTIVSTAGYTAGDYAGRVTLRDDPRRGAFTVTLSGLRRGDAGTYRCGIGTSNRDLFVSLNLTVSPEAAAVGSTELIWGELRGSARVLCPPGDHRGGKRRFWCKLGRAGCTLIADSDGHVRRGYQGRVSISPQEGSGAFKVLISDLRKEDSGLYQCGMGSLGGQSSPHTVALQVTTGRTGSTGLLLSPGWGVWDAHTTLSPTAASTLPKRPKILVGTAGGRVSLTCRYDPEGSYDQKYLCRWKEGSCSLLVDTDGFVHESYAGRLQITSGNRANGTYTVVMRHLREEDEGWYWCGARSGRTEHTSSLKLLVWKGRC